MILIRKTVFVLLLMFIQKGYSQTIDDSLSRSKIESFIGGKVLLTDLTIDQLALEIVKPEWSGKDKAYAIFYWIASNIKYDYEGFENGYWKKYYSDFAIAQDTYKYKKGVCSGYSHLYKLMCLKVGLDCKTIDGFSRSEVSEAGLPIEKSDHTWNVVRIGNKWELVDATWGSIPTLNGNEKINRYYFFTPPQEFVSNHFPEEMEWQLVKSPVTKEEFNRYPYLSSNYFKLFFDKSFPKEGLLNCNKGIATIVLGSPPGLNLLLKIYDYNQEKWVEKEVTITKQDSKSNIQVKLNSKGKYLIEIDGMQNDKDTYNLIKCILSFTAVNE